MPSAPQKLLVYSSAAGTAGEAGPIESSGEVQAGVVVGATVLANRRFKRAYCRIIIVVGAGLVGIAEVDRERRARRIPGSYKLEGPSLLG
jgi:hypothetical protein